MRSERQLPLNRETKLSRSAIDRIAVALATVGGAGFLPKAPGTAGSFVSLLVFVILDRFFPRALELPLRLSAILFLTLVGVWASGRLEKVVGRHDPAEAVIDEFVGLQVSLLTLPATPRGAAILAVGFIAFRAFDIGKPFPVRSLQRAPGGWGILLDDVGAGVYAMFVVWLVNRIFFSA